MTNITIYIYIVDKNCAKYRNKGWKKCRRSIKLDF